MVRLHINIDHVATLRNARGTRYPDPVEAARLVERAGADGVTVHLREDRRHIRDDDVRRLRGSVTTLLNLEMAATAEMTRLAEALRPDVITLVPERREERTTEGGLDVVAQRRAIEPVAAMCERVGIKLSLFVAPDAEQLAASRGLGARQVELHTGEYCQEDLPEPERRRELARLAEAASLAHRYGLEVAAGHGLTVANVVDVAALPELVELNIGHSVIADAVFVGLEAAVRSLREAVVRGVARRPGAAREGRGAP